MVWTPIPRGLGTAIANIFRGSLGRIAWKLFLLVVGSLVILLTVTVTSSWLVLAIVGIIVSIGVSSTIRRALVDLWHKRFYRL